MKEVFAVALAAILVFVWGIGIGYDIGKSKTQKDFVAQCQKSQFYFANGVGIQCPAVVDNRVTKGEQ